MAKTKLNPMPAHSTPEPISLLLCALGGEGGGVLKNWLVDVAHHAGHAAQATSIPGVAQRTGATTYYVEIHPEPLPTGSTHQPVFALNPLPGRLDVLVASELLEASRQVLQGMTTAQRTLVISSTARTLTVAEKTALGDGRQGGAELQALLREHSRGLHLLDMSALAQEAGTIVSAVMLGALAASGVLPFVRAHYEAVVGAGGKAAAASLRGFALGHDTVLARQRPAQWLSEIMAPVGEPARNPVVDPLSTPWLQGLPATAHELVRLGAERLVDYQNAAYAQRYQRRLLAVWAAEQARDNSATQGAAITCEMARWLALWMAYDDVVRVADLKSRRARWQRVQREVKAEPGEILRLYDHFKPGIPELAGLLPEPWASRLLDWEQRRAQQGRTPWALPIKVATHSVSGILLLRTLAQMRRLRPWSSRFQREQALIERWWQAVIDGTATDWTLGHELAQCGRLIKGYGSTNERGKHNLLHIVDHLASAPHLSPAQRAAAVAAARQAALADESGRSLDASLRQAGVPARQLREQPIRWIRRPPAAGQTVGPG